MITHGNMFSYNRGCRCNKCKEANRIHSFRFRMKVKMLSLKRQSDKKQREDLVLHNFRKNPCIGSQIFECSECGVERVYGCSFITPEVKMPLILCEGTCKRNTIHIFVRVHDYGRPERLNAGISNST